MVSCLCMSFCFLSPDFPCSSSRYERRAKFSVEDGRDWDTPTRWMISSSQAGHGSSRFLLRPISSTQFHMFKLGRLEYALL